MHTRRNLAAESYPSPEAQWPIDPAHPQPPQQRRESGAHASHSLLDTLQANRSGFEAPADRGVAPASALHAAVANRDLQSVQALVRHGTRPTVVDRSGKTALDSLDSLEPSIAAQMRRAMLRSSNPSAPHGYTKPEALHGSPWGIEILADERLIGGRHAPKGGYGSLEGMVFFSTRAPEKTGNTTVRSDLRTGPRRYAKGGASSANSPQQAGIRYRLTSTLVEQIERRAFSPIEGEDELMADTRADLVSKIRSQIGLSLSIAAQRIPAGNAEELDRQLRNAPIYTSLIQSTSQGNRYRIQGDELRSLYLDALAQLRESQESSGTVPLLCLINRGTIVPLVFGFEKVSGLLTHRLNSGKLHAYQIEAHPLAGSERGGRLKEIEVASHQDLATLSLGCLAKGVQLPADIVVRINPSASAKRRTGQRAIYLTPQEVRDFQARLNAKVSTLTHTPPGLTGDTMTRASLGQLQHINERIRTWVANGVA